MTASSSNLSSRHVGRRVFRVVLYSLLALVVMAAALWGWALYAGGDRQSTFYAVDAEFSDPRFLEKLEAELQKTDPLREDLGFGFSAHRLQAGQGLVLAYRYFSPGTSAIDDESYEKLTIWIRSPRSLAERQAWQLPAQGIAIFSFGGSAWPRNDCSGHVQGVVEVVPLKAGAHVRVEGTFEPMASRGRVDPCSSREVSMAFDVERAMVADLTPWLGGPGAKHPYDESYGH